MEITAVVKRVEPTKVVGQNGFEMRNLIVTTEEQYPQVLAVQFVQNNVNLLDALGPGEKVKVQINLRGREVTNQAGEVQVFNTIQGWKIEVLP